jgi:hypothetical protein
MEVYKCNESPTGEISALEYIHVFISRLRRIRVENQDESASVCLLSPSAHFAGNNTIA